MNNGNLTVTKVPSSALDSIKNSPLCASTIRLVIANPKPVPEDFVEKNG